MAKLSAPIRAHDYAHSPVHHAVVLGDHKTLTRLISTLPKLSNPSQIHTESQALSEEHLADRISSLLDRRDVPNRETPLHLAVRLNDSFSARALAASGADVSLQNSAGWNPLQEAVCRRYSEIGLTLLRFHHRSAWSKWRRRLPRLVAVLRRMRDFYMEISFHFESSVIPFVGKMAPSDTYKIWKRDGNLRADTSLAGFDGLKIQRCDQSFLFLGDEEANLPSGSLLVLNHDQRKIFNAFENADAPMTESEISEFWSQKSVYRPGMDVTKAELVGRTNWRKQEKMETVGDWKARVYDVHNVMFSFRSRKVSAPFVDEEQLVPLELDDEAEEGFLVADVRRHSSFVRQDREFISNGRKSFDVKLAAADRRRVAAAIPQAAVIEGKEKEFTKTLRPSIWLTEQFPLKTDELLPLLDILANKVKAVRRVRELLTTKFPPGSFPIKVAIPVVPTVRVLVTFTKFMELPPIDQFYTPVSSPGYFLKAEDGTEEEEEEEQQTQVSSNNKSQQATGNHSSSASSWLRRTNSHLASKQNQLCPAANQGDTFSIPSDYTWASIQDNTPKMRKSRSTNKKGK